MSSGKALVVFLKIEGEGICVQGLMEVPVITYPRIERAASHPVSLQLSPVLQPPGLLVLLGTKSDLIDFIRQLLTYAQVFVLIATCCHWSIHQIKLSS